VLKGVSAVGVAEGERREVKKELLLCCCAVVRI